MGDRDQTVKGLAGLVVLGSAWESRDIFEAISTLMARDHTSKVSALAWERAKELTGSAKNPYEEMSDQYWGLDGGVSRQDIQLVEKEYRTLKAEADKWEKAREDFMLARLKAGRHPDTDPTFWSGYIEAPAPVWKDSWRVVTWRWIEANPMWLSLLALATFSASVYFVVRITKRLIERFLSRRPTT